MSMLSLAVTPSRSLALCALLVAAHADGAISATSGAFQQIAPPTSAVLGSLPANPFSFCWTEQTGVALPNLLVNTVGGGSFGGPAANGPISINGTFDSHFIHVDPLANFGNPSGTIWFTSNIVAVIYEGVFLDITDSSLGSPGTIYPTGDPLRSHSAALGPSQYTVVANTISLNLWAYGSATWPNRMVQMRVITEAVPAPGAATLAVLAAAAGRGRARRR